MDPFMWSDGETRALLGIRAEIDPDFPEDWQQDQEEEEEGISDVVAGDSYLWEVISSGMKERGYNRNPQQCKANWTYLLSRYTTHLQEFEEEEEGEELTKATATFPFYKEMQVIFNARMQRMLWLVAARGCRSSPSSAGYHHQHQLELEPEKGEEHGGQNQTDMEKEKETKGGDDGCSRMTSSRVIRSMNGVREMMEEMLEKEMVWAKVYQERRARAKARDEEKQWRRRMAEMENESKRRKIVWTSNGG